jgi:hypothetical protein
MDNNNYDNHQPPPSDDESEMELSSSSSRSSPVPAPAAENGWDPHAELIALMNHIDAYLANPPVYHPVPISAEQQAELDALGRDMDAFLNPPVNQQPVAPIVPDQPGNAQNQLNESNSSMMTESSFTETSSNSD